jgi:hypothetical protein
MKDEVLELKKELEQVKKSFAYELLEENNTKNKRIYNICKMLVGIILLQFILVVGLVCYTLYLINDIETTTTEEIIEVEQDSGDNGNNNFINGNENEVNN